MPREGRSWVKVSNEEEQIMNVGAAMLDARLMFTPTQQRILALLSDGKAHRHEEIRQCLPDELGDRHNIAAHLTAIRKVLRPRGEDIACQHIAREHYYIHVRLLHSPYDGQV